MAKVVVSGSFDDLRSRDVRFLEEASKLGDLHVLAWSDQSIAALEDKPPKFNQDERLYFLHAIRYVYQVTIVDVEDSDILPNIAGMKPNIWVVYATDNSEAKQNYCEKNEITYIILTEGDLEGFPVFPVSLEQTDNKKVLVTGCFDWFHSGHVRFFEEASELGDLYVVVGHDKNIELLKGAGHPQFKGDERRYMVQAIRYVKQGLVSSGKGWMDAEPEIARIKPDQYAVNEDGDKPEKREFCEQHGLEYVVLKRTPKEGLPKRESTQLRGF
jgi:cytidyltransferase-like protein